MWENSSETSFNLIFAYVFYYYAIALFVYSVMLLTGDVFVLATGYQESVKVRFFPKKPTQSVLWHFSVILVDYTLGGIFKCNYVQNIITKKG